MVKTPGKTISSSDKFLLKTTRENNNNIIKLFIPANGRIPAPKNHPIPLLLRLALSPPRERHRFSAHAAPAGPPGAARAPSAAAPFGASGARGSQRPTSGAGFGGINGHTGGLRVGRGAGGRGVVIGATNG